MTTVAIVQARMGSAKLPGKALLEMGGQPLLAHVVNRTRRARRVHQVMVATTTEKDDDPIEGLCRERGWRCFRGQTTDSLDRLYRAAGKMTAGRIVRVSGDCPLVDPALIDTVVARLEAVPDADLATNTFPRRTYPRGMEIEAMHFTALELAWKEDSDAASRDGVTSFLYQHPERFRVEGIVYPQDHSEHRWLVETPDDLTLMKKIFAAFGHASFSWREAVDVAATLRLR